MTKLSDAECVEQRKIRIPEHGYKSQILGRLTFALATLPDRTSILPLEIKVVDS
jgi:hypothetical protein